MMKEIFIKKDNGDLEKVVVSDEVAELLESFRREDEREQRKTRRRISKQGGPDLSYEDEWMGSYEFENRLIDNLELKEAIATLSDKQKSRLLKYYIMGYTFCEIAEMEGSAHKSIQENIKAALKKIKKFLD